MNTVKPWLNTNFVKRDGTSAVYLVVYIGSKAIKFNIYIYCSVDNWDTVNLRVKGKSKKAADDNLIIETSLATMTDIFVRYRLQNIDVTPEIVKNEWRNPARRINFWAFTDEILAEKKSDIAHATYIHHKSVFTIIKLYSPKLAFSEITPEYIDALQRWLKKTQKNDINTIHGKMRVMRNYLNIAVQRGIIRETPFSRVKLKKATVNRVYLTETELQKLWELYNARKLNETHTKVLRHFLFMCFTGLRISDFKALTIASVHENKLVFQVTKTKNVKRNTVKVPLNKYAMQLMANEPRRGALLFNAISDQKMNTYIKQVMAIAKIHKDISNHSARHTFATLWLSKTNDLAQLQALLGHSNITETMGYVHITDEGMKAQMHNFENTLFAAKTKNPLPLPEEDLKHYSKEEN